MILRIIYIFRKLFFAFNTDISPLCAINSNARNMELLKPSEISGRILTLLDESDERVVIVSPYMKISKWYKLLNKINGLKNRGVQAEIYVRDDPDNVTTYRDLDQLALPFKKIPHLHSKLYMNERSGIITSMNLLLSSEINSLEIGCATETWEEYNGLMDLYHRYIHIGQPVNCITISGQPATEVKVIVHRIREQLRKEGIISWVMLKGNTLYISTANSNYTAAINNGYLGVTVSLRVQPDSLSSVKIAKKVRDLTKMKVGVHPGPGPDIIRINGQAKKELKSTSVCGLLENEVASIIDSIRMFVANTDEMIFP